MEKLTERKIYETIAAGMSDSIDRDTLIAWAEKKIAQLDRKAEKAKETAAAKKAEGDALTEAVLAAVGDEFEPISEIAARVNAEDATVSKVSYRLNAAFKAGILEKDEITLESPEGGRKRKVIAYRRAQ